MQDYIRIDNHFAVGKGHPDAEALTELRDHGFRSVVNLRTHDEQNQPLNPDQEGAAVRQLGMNYLHIPVSTQALAPGLVDRFREQVALLPKPVYVHCALGKRSGAFTMMDRGIEQGLSGQDTVDQAAQMGFLSDAPALEKLVRDYVDHHHRKH